MVRLLSTTLFLTFFTIACGGSQKKSSTSSANGGAGSCNFDRVSNSLMSPVKSVNISTIAAQFVVQILSENDELVTIDFPQQPDTPPLNQNLTVHRDVLQAGANEAWGSLTIDSNTFLGGSVRFNELSSDTNIPGMTGLPVTNLWTKFSGAVDVSDDSGKRLAFSYSCNLFGVAGGAPQPLSGSANASGNSSGGGSVANALLDNYDSFFGIKAGMSEADVRQVLGQPDKITTSEYNARTLEYYDGKLEIYIPERDEVFSVTVESEMLGHSDLDAIRAKGLNTAGIEHMVNDGDQIQQKFGTPLAKSSQYFHYYDLPNSEATARFSCFFDDPCDFSIQF